MAVLEFALRKHRAFLDGAQLGHEFLASVANLRKVGEGRLQRGLAARLVDLYVGELRAEAVHLCSGVVEGDGERRHLVLEVVTHLAKSSDVTVQALDFGQAGSDGLAVGLDVLARGGKRRLRVERPLVRLAQAELEIVALAIGGLQRRRKLGHADARVRTCLALH